jgi:hypothetical protein
VTKFQKPLIIQKLIQLAIYFLSGQTALPIDTTNALCDLHYSQSEIGWDQFLRGRISKKWRLVYSKLTTSKQKVNPSVWTAWFIKAIWQHSHSTWKNRNHVVHNQNKKTISSIALSKLHQKTSELYIRYSNDPHMIPEYLRYLFKHPLLLCISCWKMPSGVGWTQSRRPVASKSP